MLLYPKIPNGTKGFLLIEVVLAVGMFTVVLISISAYFQKALEVSKDTTRRIQSGFLLEEGIEAVKFLRDQSWDAEIATLTPGTSYYLYWDGGTWVSTTTPQMIEDIFTRSFRLANVNRDFVSNDIVSSGGYTDVGTKKLFIDVAWLRRGGGATTTDSAETYITNLFSN
jgi:Tfp pilus assembly protein PilV